MDDDRICRGDVRPFTAPPGADAIPALCVVLAADRRAGCCEVALVHAYPELATSFDGLVPPGLSGTTFPVVVQSDLRGMVWLSQVGARVGRLSDQVLADVSALVMSDSPAAPAPSGVQVGTRLLGPFDRRWAFKADQGVALGALTAGCTATLLGSLRC